MLNYQVPPATAMREQPIRLVAGLLAWSLVVLIATVYLYVTSSMGIVLSFVAGIPASVLSATMGLVVLPPRRRWRLLAWWGLPLAVSLGATVWLAYRGAQGVD